MRHCLFIIALSVLLAPNISIAKEKREAEPKPCKPRLRANRHKTMTFDDRNFYKLLSYTYTDRDGYILHIVPMPGYDSVYVSGAASAVFTARYIAPYGKQVLAPYIAYRHEGAVQVDSIHATRGGAVHTYYAGYMSSRVYATYNAAAGVLHYYSIKGEDSIRFTNESNGNKSTQWFNRYGNDSVFQTLNPDGMLSFYRKRTNAISDYDSTVNYYPSGVPEDITDGIDISKRQVKRVRTFHTNGKLRSEEHYCEGQPCYVWKYYNENGKLTTSQRKKGVTTFPITGYGVVEAPPPPQVFTMVEQMAEYPGGITAFKKYMDSRLANILCSSPAKLDGVYKLTVTLALDGKMTYERGEGMNIAAISSELQELFAKMPYWKPGKRNGQNTITTMRFDVVIK